MYSGWFSAHLTKSCSIFSNSSLLIIVITYYFSSNRHKFEKYLKILAPISVIHEKVKYFRFYFLKIYGNVWV
ncbi:MAG: hypothetical protein DRO88_11015 [Promethearchaeia archaeon]|nr:MAG: hypothetical protein DRO88_11015 [Candidatus Lokiarchaeia archaeon]